MEIANACEMPVSKNAKNQKILETAIFPMGKSETHFRFKIGSRYYREQEVAHCTGTLSKLELEEISDETLTTEYMKEFNVTTFETREDIYSDLETKIDKYFEYGGLFKIMQSIKIALEAQEMLNELELSDYESWDKGGYIFHPAHLDGVLQTFCVIGLMQQSTPYRSVPTGIQNLHFYGKPTGPKLYVCTTRHRGDLRAFHADMASSRSSSGPRTPAASRSLTARQARLLHPSTPTSARRASPPS